MLTWLSRLGALKPPRQPELGSSEQAGRAALLPEPVGPDLEPGLAVEAQVGVLGGEPEHVAPAAAAPGLLVLGERQVGDAVERLRSRSAERRGRLASAASVGARPALSKARQPDGRRRGERRPPIQGARSAAGCWSASGG